MTTACKDSTSLESGHGLPESVLARRVLHATTPDVADEDQFMPAKKPAPEAAKDTKKAAKTAPAAAAPKAKKADAKKK